MVDTKDSYQRPYKMRSTGRDGLNTVVSIPPQVIERESRKRGITVQEFLESHSAVAQYDSFDGVFYSFEPNKKDGNNVGT